VLFPYLYDAGKLESRLVLSMPKEQILKTIGQPDRVIQDDGQQAIWEYRVYSKGEWAGYLVHCPFHPFCYFPTRETVPYYVALQEDRLCIWGTPDVVSSLVRKVCGTNMLKQGQAGTHSRWRGSGVSGIPVFMPPLLSPLPQRLAIVPLPGTTDERVNSWLDLMLSFLRTRHRELILVEREDLRAILEEVSIQYSGRVAEDTVIRVGRLAGADSLLTYRLGVIASGAATSASFELRVLDVEHGTSVFRQIASSGSGAPVAEAVTGRADASLSLRRRLVIEESVAFGLSALAAAFGDNPLGVVPDYTWPRQGVKVIGLLQGGPAFQAGLEPGDEIVQSNNQQLRSWTDPVLLPAHVTVMRNGVNLEFNVLE
jgi:hypothetical protein